jgi:hypothetical protein
MGRLASGLCGGMSETVDWEDRGIICETCDQWYHAGCQNIHTISYQQLGDSELNIRANRNAVVNVNSNLMVSANNILLFLKKYQVNFGDLDIDCSKD